MIIVNCAPLDLGILLKLCGILIRTENQLLFYFYSFFIYHYTGEQPKQRRSMCTARALERYEPRAAADKSSQSKAHVVDPAELIAKRGATSVVVQVLRLSKVRGGPNNSRVANFPRAAKLARYLCLPATSTSSESS